MTTAKSSTWGVARSQHISRTLRHDLAVPLLLVLFVLTLVVCATIGSVPMSPGFVAGMPFRKLGVIASSAADAQNDAVLLAIRAPRLVLGMLIGSTLALSGVAVPVNKHNDLADPALLGISSGSALGAVASIVFGAHVIHVLSASVMPFVLPFAAFAGAMVSMVAIERMARFEGRTSITMLLLAGIAVNALCQAAMGFCVYMANDAQLRTITFWNLGSLGGATWTTVLSAAPFLSVPLLVLPRCARSLDAILLGEAEAGHLGVSVERTKRIVFMLVALGVGASVASAGIIGFVGLVVPHLLRLALGPKHRILMPATALAGATLLLIADAVARTIVSPAELPLGLVTAAIGTPFFLALLVRERRSLA